MRAAGVAPGLGGYRPAPRNAQWIELPDASAVACAMKPTQAAGGNCPHEVRCVLAKRGSGLARTERVRGVSLRLYRISPSPAGRIDRGDADSRSSKNPVDSQDTKAHEECSSCALAVVLFGSRKRREVEVRVSDALLTFFFGLRIADH